jgi:hypothetical protein
LVVGGSSRSVQRRTIERRPLSFAEDAARELPSLPPRDVLQLVHPYAERGAPTYLARCETVVGEVPE